MKKHFPVVICGAGPAGLTAAYQLVKREIRPVVLEKTGKIGGTARTEIYKGFRFDIGGHRFFTKIEDVNRLWLDILGDELLKVRRLSRIYYDGKFFKYPIELTDALGNLGVIESLLVLFSYIRAKAKPYTEENTFEQWVVNHFGSRLYRIFFKTYTEKIWGIPCSEIHAEWAAQRIRGLSLTATVTNALFGVHQTKTLVREFLYPMLGTGMMWDRFREEVEKGGGLVKINSPVVRFMRDGNRIRKVVVRDGEDSKEISGEHFISSIPLPELIFRFAPPAPAEVLYAARQLAHRAFIIVGLIIDREHVFPDTWIYVHSSEVRVGRLQNFGNWSPSMVPDPKMTGLGMEYFCTEGDDIWEMPDAALIELARRELDMLGLAKGSDVREGKVFRQPKAYPVYSDGYQKHLKVIKDFLMRVDNLQSIGRNGMHRYNNMDHSMLTAMLSVENIMGAKHDQWGVNKKQDYLEEKNNL